MYQENFDQSPEVAEQIKPFAVLPVAIEVQSDQKVAQLIAELSPDVSWGDRQMAAKKLGTMGSPEALDGLLNALLADPFWMVRCAIIQALERIGDPRAIPALHEVANGDGFQVVRSYAFKAIERLSH
jgi:HEAT repeat protein